MSYDLYLLDRDIGEDPADALEQMEEEDVAATAEQAETVRRLGAALQTALPALEDNAGDAAGADEVHLLDPEGLEVTVYARFAEVTFPYWDSLDTGALVRDLERVAAVVEEHTGWRMYDPQQEAWIDPLRDAEALREAFDHGRAIVRDMVVDDAVPERRPWWRRLGGR